VLFFGGSGANHSTSILAIGDGPRPEPAELAGSTVWSLYSFALVETGDGGIQRIREKAPEGLRRAHYIAGYADQPTKGYDVAAILPYRPLMGPLRDTFSFTRGHRLSRVHCIRIRQRAAR